MQFIFKIKNEGKRMKKKQTNQKPGTTATLTNENIQLMLCNKYIKCYIKIESLLFKVNTLGSMR